MKPHLIAILFIACTKFSFSQLLPPINITASVNNCEGITLTWERNTNSSNFDLYHIYRAVNETGPYDFFATSNSSATSYTDASCLESHKKYYYKIKAAIASPFSSSDFSNMVFGELNCPFVQNIRLKTNRCNAIEIEWDPVNSVNLNIYQIYRSNSATGPFVSKGYTSKTDLTFLDTDITPTNTYYYKVAPQFTNCGNINEALLSAVQLTSICPTQAPVLAGSSIDCQKIQLEWESFSSQYQPIVEVHYATNENGPFYPFREYSYSQLSNIIVDSFDPSKTHYFKIRGKFGMFNSYYTNFSNVVSVTTTCPKIENFRITSTLCGEVNLAWDFEPNQLENLSTTIFFREKGTQISPQSFDLQYPVNSYRYLLNQNVAYEFWLMFRRNGSKIYDSDTLSSSLFTCPDAPRVNIAQANCDEVLLTWQDFEAPNTETEYYLNISTTPDGPFTHYQYLPANTTQYLFRNQDNAFAKAYFKLSAKIGGYTLAQGPTSSTDFSSNIETLKTGNWWDESTWSCLRIPKATDTIKINTGHVISVQSNTIARTRALINNGQLNLLQNAELKLIDSNTPVSNYEGCCGLKPGIFNGYGMNVYVPNVFTPNNDGINDYFVPSVNNAVQFISGYTISDLQNNILFERYYFNLNDIPNYAWNGNVYHPNGTFKEFYSGPFKYQMFTINSNNQNIVISGNACVLRCPEAHEPTVGNPNCVYGAQGDNGFLNKSFPTQEPACN